MVLDIYFWIYTFGNILLDYIHFNFLDYGLFNYLTFIGLQHVFIKLETF